MKRLILALTLMVPLSSHAGFITGVIVGHAVSDGDTVVEPEKQTYSYNPATTVRCVKYNDLTHMCRVKSTLEYLERKNERNYTHTYDVYIIARLYLAIEKPKIKAVHVMDEDDILVEFNE